MKYLKKYIDWGDRYEFLQNTPPSFFVLYFPNGITNGDGTPYIWYYNDDDTQTINGTTYVFYKINGVKTNNTTYTIQLDKPLVAGLNLSYTFTGSVNGVDITTSSIKYVESGVTSFTLTIPTIVTTSSGQQITIADDFQIEDLDIHTEQTNYSQGVVVLTK